MRGSRSPLFRDGGTAAAALVTLGALTTVEAVDMSVKPNESDRVDDRGTGLMFATAMAVAISASAWSLARADRRPLPRNRLFAAGISSTWAGLLLNRWARRTLGAQYRPMVTIVEGHDVVVSGPYRWVRHPMYLGGLLTCVGVGTAMGTPLTTIVWLLPPIGLMRRLVVEERVLIDSLGDRYSDYAATRRRLLPGVW